MKNTPNDSRNIVIEQNKRFSESCIWKLQREYFEKSGINAWVNQVPFYITSNPFIAHCYAKLIINFIRDYLRQKPEAKNAPFYILELGTGSGRFSYYLVKALEAFCEAYGLQDISICYVMSDFTKNNIQYYETHPALLPYIEKGWIDFALFDMETKRPITLLRKNIALNQESLVNPLTVVANYIFDTVSHDAFAVHEGKLYELLLNTSTPEQNMVHNSPASMEQLTTSYSVKEVKHPFYNDPDLDNILESYKTTLSSSSFLLPIGSIRAINLLKKLSNDQLFIISSDKGYSTTDALDHLGHPSLSFHGSFSLMVNFHAIATYFKSTGGDYFLQTSRRGIKTSVFCYGFQLQNMPETTMAIQEHVEDFAPTDYFTLHRRMSDTFQTCDLDTIAAHLQLAKWDPHIYLKLSNHIISLIEKADKTTIEFMASNMHKIAANYYYMPKSECILFEIAVFFHAIKRYAEALKYYQQASQFIGEQFSLFYNMALCQQSLGMTEDALKNFKEAARLDPQSKEAADWISHLEGTGEGGGVILSPKHPSPAAFGVDLSHKGRGKCMVAKLLSPLPL